MSTLSIVLGFGIPVLIAPLAVLGLRPLFVQFLQNSTGWFTSRNVPEVMFQSAGLSLARLNVLMLALTWIIVFSCIVAELPSELPTATAVFGVLATILATAALVRSQLNIDRQTSFYIGVVAFGGGNLPLFLLVPVLLVVL